MVVKVLIGNKKAFTQQFETKYTDDIDNRARKFADDNLKRVRCEFLDGTPISDYNPNWVNLKPIPGIERIK